MRLARVSPLTGKTNVMDIPITPEEFEQYRLRQRTVSSLFPHLTKAEREFLITGYTQEDWDTMFPPGWAGDDDEEATA